MVNHIFASLEYLVHSTQWTEKPWLAKMGKPNHQGKQSFCYGNVHENDI